MLLLTGPPAAGKTAFCLDEFRSCLRKGAPACRMLVPTTTMAEHLRNELAREGFVLSPRSITTFSRFIDELALGLPGVSTGALEIIAGELLDRLPLARYAAVRDYPGFRSGLVGAIEEFTGAGGRPEHLPLTDPDFRQVCEAVLGELNVRGLYLRASRLSWAAARIQEQPSPGQVWVTGFTGFTPPEIEVLRALAAQTRLVVTLPDTSSAVEPLRAFASEFRQLSPAEARERRILVAAPTPEAEASEIARRILAEAAQGRPFREMAIVLRSEKPAAPALRSALDRFGIPARFYFAPVLSDDATVRYLLALANAALSGWDHEIALRALRMHGSPLESIGDEWEHEILKRIPRTGLESLREGAPRRTQPFFDELEKLSSWPADQCEPSVWGSRFAALCDLFRAGVIPDHAPQDLTNIWRTQAAALAHFRESVAETAAVLRPGVAVSCREFRDALRTVLASGTLRVVDHRRDVVHVIDAIEARQWRMPVVFVCGLLEGQFPKHHAEDAIVPDAARRRLKAAGVPVKTSAERQTEEQLLFDMVLTRATEMLVLSYGRLNGRGERNLPSFLLPRAKPYAEEPAGTIRPLPAVPRPPETQPALSTPELRTAVASKHAKVGPSAIEVFLQCPFQFFAERTLQLASPPCDPWKRLDPRVQGTLAHRVLERHFKDGVPVPVAFAEAFEEARLQNGLPEGYRTEAIRLELLYGIELLVADKRLKPSGTTAQFEQKFSFALDENTVVRGRIDRLEVDDRNHAVVFDYKYRRKTRIRESISDNEDGTKVQGGLYLLGAQSLGYKPAGMVYCGFKREVSVAGWVLTPLYPHLGSACSSSHIEDVMQKSREVSLQAVSDIRDGRIAPHPADTTRCDFCAFSAMCRVEISPARKTAGGADAAE